MENMSIITKMEKRITEHQNIINHVESIREVVKKFNGKVLNKRFTAALESKDSALWGRIEKCPYNKPQHTMTIYTRNNSYNTSTIVYVYNCETVILDENGKIDEGKFAILLDKIVQSNLEEIEKLKQDIKTGYDRIAQWNEMAMRMNKIKSEMSSYFKELARHNFEYIIK